MTSIGSIAIYVADLERSERFYVDALGLEVVARIDTPDVREVIVANPGEGSQLMLAQRTIPDGAIAPSGMWKVFLFTDDAGALYRRAVSAGAEPVAEPELLGQFNITIGFVKDPDGYLIELGQRH